MPRSHPRTSCGSLYASTTSGVNPSCVQWKGDKESDNSRSLTHRALPELRLRPLAGTRVLRDVENHFSTLVQQHKSSNTLLSRMRRMLMSQTADTVLY